MASHCGSGATQRGPWHWHSDVCWSQKLSAAYKVVLAPSVPLHCGLANQMLVKRPHLTHHCWLEGSRCCKNASFVYSWNWPHLAGSKPNVTFQNGFLIARVASLVLLNLAINPQLLLFTPVRSTLLRIDDRPTCHLI